MFAKSTFVDPICVMPIETATGNPITHLIIWGL